MAKTFKPIPHEVNIIARALDEISEKYEENNKIIFRNESDRAKQHFASINRQLKGWSKSKQCMAPGCIKRSIKRSHTIPKGMSLRTIGENGHVLIPSFDNKHGKVVVEKTGLSDATTFPGFCSEHELLFEEFENSGRLVSEPDIYLQAYRAACRESFRTKYLIEQHDWTMSNYINSRDEGLTRLIQERAQSLGYPKQVNIQSFKIDCDQLVEGANERIAPVRRLFKHLDERILPALECAVFHRDESDIAVTATSIDLEIPVALTGSAPFFVRDKSNDAEVVLIMNVIPQIGSTLIIMAVHASEADMLEAYKERWMTHALTMLSMIESWMINGTDQWCIRPSVWNRLPTDRTENILTALTECNKNIGDECEISVFDGLRSSIIDLSNTANANNLTSEYIRFIKAEKKKMS